MLKFNYHNHTRYCDGSATMEAMIQSAIHKGMTHFGISSHGPIPFKTDWTMPIERLQDYFEEARRLKTKYLDQIHVFIGLEIDYIPGYELDDKLKRALPSLDYIIGSVHFSGKRIGDLMWTVDYTKEELLEGIRVSYEGDSQKAIKAYFQHVSEMVETIRPKIVGHLDLIKKSNEAMILFDEGDQWYREAVCECLDRIEKAGSIVEINTGGKSRGYSNEYYPSVWIIHEMLKRNIPVTISADAHATETVDYDFHKAAQLLERIGYRQIHYLTNTGWETVDVRRLT